MIRVKPHNEESSIYEESVDTPVIVRCDLKLPTGKVAKLLI